MQFDLIRSVKNIIIQAGKTALQLRSMGLVTERKQDNSPVTNADKEISNFIYSALNKLTPDIPVICEEQPIKHIDPGKQFWLIDPIDGTGSFIRGESSFTINIALISQNQPANGFIYLPATDRLYYTDKEQNFCIEQNGVSIKPQATALQGLIALVGSGKYNLLTENYLKKCNFYQVIVMPSSIKLCMIAEGTGDIYPKFGRTMEWDIAAGHALINATGGRVTDLAGQELLYGKAYFCNQDFFAYGRRVNKKTV